LNLAGRGGPHDHPSPAFLQLNTCLTCRFSFLNSSPQGEEGYIDYPFLEESEEGKAFLHQSEAPKMRAENPMMMQREMMGKI